MNSNANPRQTHKKERKQMPQYPYTADTELDEGPTITISRPEDEAPITMLITRDNGAQIDWPMTSDEAERLRDVLDAALG